MELLPRTLGPVDRRKWSTKHCKLEHAKIWSFHPLLQPQLIRKKLAHLHNGLYCRCSLRFECIVRFLCIRLIWINVGQELLYFCGSWIDFIYWIPGFVEFIQTWWICHRLYRLSVDKWAIRMFLGSRSEQQIVRYCSRWVRLTSVNNISPWLTCSPLKCWKLLEWPRVLSCKKEKNIR